MVFQRSTMETCNLAYPTLRPWSHLLWHDPSLCLFWVLLFSEKMGGSTPNFLDHYLVFYIDSNMTPTAINHGDLLHCPHHFSHFIFPLYQFSRPLIQLNDFNASIYSPLRLRCPHDALIGLFISYLSPRWDHNFLSHLLDHGQGHFQTLFQSTTIWVFLMSRHITSFKMSRHIPYHHIPSCYYMPISP